jgi:hypothetical protein
MHVFVIIDKPVDGPQGGRQPSAPPTCSVRVHVWTSRFIAPMYRCSCNVTGDREKGPLDGDMILLYLIVISVFVQQSSASLNFIAEELKCLQQQQQLAACSVHL